MKILFAPNVWSERARIYNASILEAGKHVGFAVSLFELTPSAPKPRYTWTGLDTLWNQRRKFTISRSRKRELNALLQMKDALLAAAQNADVLWVYNGGNFHPDWLGELPKHLLKVFCCFDDPESSHELSEPVAPYFDACFTGNISAIPLYQKWGCKHVEWTPIFTVTGLPNLSKEEFESTDRKLPLVFLGERVSPWRQKRLDCLVGAFPGGVFCGPGWRGGFKEHAKEEYYPAAQIGINLHNSIGPINLRTFELPAHGVMQMCDNKCRLGSIFRLDEEVVGYDSFSEGIDLVKYYLAHSQERQGIAWNGYSRYWRDYAPEAVWRRAAKQFKTWLDQKNGENLGLPFSPAKSPSLAVAARKAVKKILPPILLDPLSPSGYQVSSASSFAQWVSSSWQTSVSGIQVAPYIPNSPCGAVNLQEKIDRLNNEGTFEWPNMVALNWTVASMVGDAKKIVEVGGGAGCFAYEAGADPKRSITCLEDDDGARNWAAKHRARQNITYSKVGLEDFADNVFDLLVTIDVVEHIGNYHGFLRECSRIADKAIITTPNRFRDSPPRLNPEYKFHVQEWSAGEFYCILKPYWENIFLYTMPDPFIPLCIPCDINTTMHPLIAVCSHSRPPGKSECTYG